MLRSDFLTGPDQDGEDDDHAGEETPRLIVP
jgi:hypothetical protein